MANYSYIVFLSTLIDNILDLIDVMSIIRMCIGVVYKLDKWVWKSSMLLSLLECMTLKPRAILDSPDMIQQKLFMFFSDNQTTLIWRLATLNLRTGTSMLKVRHLIWNYRQDKNIIYIKWWWKLRFFRCSIYPQYPNGLLLVCNKSSTLHLACLLINQVSCINVIWKPSFQQIMHEKIYDPNKH